MRQLSLEHYIYTTWEISTVIFFSPSTLFLGQSKKPFCRTGIDIDSRKWVNRSPWQPDHVEGEAILLKLEVDLSYLMCRKKSPFNIFLRENSQKHFVGVIKVWQALKFSLNISCLWWSILIHFIMFQSRKIL